MCRRGEEERRGRRTCGQTLPVRLEEREGGEEERRGGGKRRGGGEKRRVKRTCNQTSPVRLEEREAILGPGNLRSGGASGEKECRRKKKKSSGENYMSKGVGACYRVP